ncbi:Small-conductance mechanosensitive channel [Cyclobacterium lianum]|uniref:Small-conductance mechanosensitive channel n=1 Tax=Cyclobacterium lianum TaxID=388280 RepID=A0A1M7Q973_9BACT|nr:mechanosensitive ion channel domain-containing protein [Cyclobacterium lianum]SHN27199.1 Small-conductance mechanosensitive channel [Cyclobacterium lianum]
MERENLIFIGIALGLLVFSHVFLWLLFPRLANLVYKPRSEKGKRSIRKFSNALKWGLFFAIFPIIEPFFSPPDLDYLGQKPFFIVLAIITISWIIIEFSNVLRHAFLENFSSNKEDNLRERRMLTQVAFIRKLFIILVVIVAISAILMNFESARKLGAGLLTSAGIVGIIVGLAAQKSIANLLAGFQIAFTQPIRIDDVVVVENEWGKIEEINLTYVVVKIWDQRRLVLPINYFIEQPFQNWTRTTADIWGTVFMYVDHTVPVENLKVKLKEILEGSPLWDKKVQVLQVTDYTEKTVEIRCLMSARDSPTAFDLRCLVREKMLEHLQQQYPESLPKSRVLLTREEEKTAEENR